MADFEGRIKNLAGRLYSLSNQATMAPAHAYDSQVKPSVLDQPKEEQEALLQGMSEHAGGAVLVYGGVTHPQQLGLGGKRGAVDEDDELDALRKEQETLKMELALLSSREKDAAPTVPIPQRKEQVFLNLDKEFEEIDNPSRRIVHEIESEQRVNNEFDKQWSMITLDDKKFLAGATKPLQDREKENGTQSQLDHALGYMRSNRYERSHGLDADSNFQQSVHKPALSQQPPHHPQHHQERPNSGPVVFQDISNMGGARTRPPLRHANHNQFNQQQHAQEEHGHPVIQIRQTLLDQQHVVEGFHAQHHHSPPPKAHRSREATPSENGPPDIDGKHHHTNVSQPLGVLPHLHTAPEASAVTAGVEEATSIRDLISGRKKNTDFRRSLLENQQPKQPTGLSEGQLMRYSLQRPVGPSAEHHQQQQPAEYEVRHWTPNEDDAGPERLADKLSKLKESRGAQQTYHQQESHSQDRPAATSLQNQIASIRNELKAIKGSAESSFRAQEGSLIAEETPSEPKTSGVHESFLEFFNKDHSPNAEVQPRKDDTLVDNIKSRIQFTSFTPTTESETASKNKSMLASIAQKMGASSIEVAPTRDNDPALRPLRPPVPRTLSQRRPPHVLEAPRLMPSTQVPAPRLTEDSELSGLSMGRGPQSGEDAEQLVMSMTRKVDMLFPHDRARKIKEKMNLSFARWKQEQLMESQSLSSYSNSQSGQPMVGSSPFCTNVSWIETRDILAERHWSLKKMGKAFDLLFSFARNQIGKRKAKSHYTAVKLFQGVRTWRRVLRERMLNFDKNRMARVHLQLTMAMRTFHKWVFYTTDKIDMLRKSRMAVAHHDNVLMVTGFAGLARHAILENDPMELIDHGLFVDSHHFSQLMDFMLCQSELSSTHYTLHLQKSMFHTWLENTGESREISRKTNKAIRYKTKRTLNRTMLGWRSSATQERYRHQCKQLAETHRRSQLLSKSFKMLAGYVHYRRFCQHRNEVAWLHDLMVTAQKHFNKWVEFGSESKRLEEKMYDAEDYYYEQLAAKAISGWLRYANSRIYKQTQTDRAYYHYDVTVATKLMGSWVDYVDNNIAQREKYQIAESHSVVQLLLKPFTALRQYVLHRHKREARYEEAWVHWSSNLLSKVFYAWDPLLDALYERRKLASNHCEKYILRKYCQKWSQYALMRKDMTGRITLAQSGMNDNYDRVIQRLEGLKSMLQAESDTVVKMRYDLKGMESREHNISKVTPLRSHRSTRSSSGSSNHADISLSVRQHPVELSRMSVLERRRLSRALSPTRRRSRSRSRSPTMSRRASDAAGIAKTQRPRRTRITTRQSYEVSVHGARSNAGRTLERVSSRRQPLTAGDLIRSEPSGERNNYDERVRTLRVASHGSSGNESGREETIVETDVSQTQASNRPRRHVRIVEAADVKRGERERSSSPRRL